LFATDRGKRGCDKIAILIQQPISHAWGMQRETRKFISSGMREIKSRYPATRVQMVFTGNASFLNNPAIDSAKNYNGVRAFVVSWEW
jgi:hypothetical protein